uniref:Uncharacterized protein n=1 Tax=Mimiviridae sp. ChoanoV1 TaxID=2596887 RepID=A0A5B8IFY0_9VIRU|nr:hypothetical protein 7_16 [Mimiviridae sp. ChoanoV1]
MKNIALNKMINYGKSIQKNPLNLNSIYNSLFGFLLALTIHNMIELVFNEFIFKIIDANIDKKKRTIDIFNSKIDLEKILELFIRILLICIFIYIFFNVNNLIK